MRIAFVDLSTKLETVHDLETRARGGMVTSLFKVSDYLARFADVEVLSDIEEAGTTEAGVKWVHEPTSPYDFLITNRGTAGGFDYITARHRILWTHDLPHLGFIPEPRTIKAYAATVFMSRFGERIWRSMYRDIGRSFLIPNGVDKSIFYPRDKDLSYILYASAPNRGLRKLPFLFDCMQARQDRPLKMVAYSNMEVLHPNEKVTSKDAWRELYEAYNEVSESQVILKDPIPQVELAEEMGRAGLLVMPTEYPEICCNVILQALASGTPVVTTGKIGSQGEWVTKKNGRLTEWLPHDYMIYVLDFVRKSCEILENEKLHRKLIQGAANTRVYSWDEIGAQWWKMLTKLR